MTHMESGAGLAWSKLDFDAEILPPDDSDPPPVEWAYQLDWDAWRQRYDEMTYQEHVRFYDLIYEHYPVQDHRTTPEIIRFLSAVDLEKYRVVEVGGWRGELAADMLAWDKRIVSWTNYEICEIAARNPVALDPRYIAFHPNQWVWQMKLGGDVGILAHVIEHMRWPQFCALIDALPVSWLYIESPLGTADEAEWDLYPGTHIFEKGWNAINEKMLAEGYRLFDMQGADIRMYRRG